MTETAAIYEAVAELERKESTGRENLLAAVKKYGGRRRLIDLLVTGCLSRMDAPALIGEVMDLANRCAENPFSYLIAYHGEDASDKPPAKSEVGNNAIWGDVID